MSSEGASYRSAGVDYEVLDPITEESVRRSAEVLALLA